jgi:ABC transporter substrate binding protein
MVVPLYNQASLGRASAVDSMGRREWVLAKVRENPPDNNQGRPTIIHLVAPTEADYRDVMIRGESGITNHLVIAAVGVAVAAGLVGSLARPGSNITGSSFFSPELAAKRLDILKEALPRVRRVGVLFNPGTLYRPDGKWRQAARCYASAIRGARTERIRERIRCCERK